MNERFPIYDVTIDDENLGLTAISFVENPAIETDFIYFKKNEIKNMIFLANKEKREIVSPILIPNQLILRQAEDGSFYYIRWTADTIKLAAEKYLANGWFNNFTDSHPMFYDNSLTYEDVLEKDVYMLRMWIIDDPSKDDANVKYGFNLPQGSLMVHLKVHNRKIWNKIRNGELKGLSIEAFTNLVDNNTLNQNKNNMKKLDVTSKQLNLFEKFISFVNEVSKEAEEISSVAKADEMESGEVELKYWLDNDHYILVDKEGYVRDMENNLVDEGKYKLADGNVLVVDGDNKFVETIANTEEVAKDEKVEAPIAEEKLKDEEDEKKDEEDIVKDEGEDGAADVETDNGDNELDVKTDSEDAGEEATEDEELVPFEIDGVEYKLPQAVIDYINALMTEKDNTIVELEQMKERIPSVKPISNVVIAQEVEDTNDSLFNAIRLLNNKK